MSSEMQLVFLIMAATTVGFFIPKFRPDLVALTSMLALFLTGILTIDEALAGFANSTVVMFAALFVVGEGIFQTGLAQKAGNLLITWSGNSEFRLTIFMIIVVAVLSAVLSNTGTVAILLPIVVILSRRMQIHPGKLLMPLAFASSMGGGLSLIGTPPNLLARQSLVDAGYEGISFFAFTPVALIILVIGTLYLWFLARRWLDKPVDKDTGLAKPFDAGDLLEQYEATEYIHPVKIPQDSNLVGKTLKELQWPSRYDLTVLEVVRKEEDGLFKLTLNGQTHQFIAEPDYMLQSDDILLVYAEPDALQEFIQETGIRKIKATARDRYHPENSNMAEVILTPFSRLSNHSILDISFRDKYGLTVLAVKHQYKKAKLPDPEKQITSGDSLLVHGEWENIDLLTKEKKDLVVLRHAAEPVTQNGSIVPPLIAGTIIICMIAAMVLELIPVVTISIIAALLMVVTRCIKSVDQAYRSVNWQTILLIATMLPMATALEKTGGVAFISEGLISSLGGIGPVAVLAGLYVVSSFFSQFISNTATAVLLFPIAIMSAQQMDVNPLPMVMAVAFSASMAFATPVATPPNAMVMAAGKYSFFDFIRVGFPLQALIAIVAIVFIPVFYPF